jgi:hypothetical protein
MNLLVDYYPEDQSRPYGSGCTRANTLPWLKQLKLGYLCIYAKGHSGFTTWQSSLHTHHKKLGKDMPKFFRELTRAANTKLVLYYSGLLDGLAGTRHPDWIMIKRDGKPSTALFADFNISIAYAICPQSAYWEKWASIQLRELIEGYNPDGIWVDGDWPGPCYCKRCLERFRKDTGWSGTLAKMILRKDFDAQYAITWKHITHEWRTRFSKFVKTLKPDCLYSAGNVSPRREFAAPFDWRSGDFFSPGHHPIQDMARMMRWYGTLAVPYDAYICDTSFTHARKQVRSRSKPLQRMLQEAATVAANGGMVGYWTYPLGNGAWVPSRMKKAITVRKFLEERKELFLHTQSAQWTAILATDPSMLTFGNAGIVGAHKALAALHRSPDIMDETGFDADLSYDLAVVPEQAVIDKKTVKKIETFVQRGGKLLTTGKSIQSPELQKLLGISGVKLSAVNDGHVILKNYDEPTGIDLPWDKVLISNCSRPLGGRPARLSGFCEGGTGINAPGYNKSEDATELYPLYLSWDQFNTKCQVSNNYPMHGQMDEEHPKKAGFPAAIGRRLGKGCLAHICTGIFGHYATLGDPQILRWLKEILAFLQPKPMFETDAPSWVDVSLRRKDNSLLIHFVNQNPGRDLCKLNTNDLWVDEIPEVGPFNVRLRCAKKPKRIIYEPSGKPVKASWQNSILQIALERLHIHSCLVINN